MNLAKQNKHVSRDKVNSRMSESRRNKMENILSREQQKGDKRQVLEQVLIEKLTKKYGGNGAFEKIISNMVGKLVKSSGRITETDIAALELAVKKMAFEKKSNSAVSVRKPSNGGAIKPYSSNAESKSNNVSKEGKSVLAGKNEWVLINALTSVEHDKSESDRYKKLQLEKEQQRKWLDSQREEKMNRKTVEQQEQLELYKQQVQDLKKWQDEEANKEKKVVQVVQTIKIGREAQLTEIAKKQARIAAQKAADEKAQVERCERLIREEKEEAKQRKIDERERMRKVLLENQKVEAHKAAVRAKDQAYDIQLMEEYARKLEKEEQDRIDALASKLRRQDEIHSGMAMSTHELIRKRAQEDEDRADEYQRRKQAADLKKEQDKEAKRKLDNIERNKFLAYQQQLKVDKKMKEKSKEQEYASKYREDGEQAQRDKARKERELREKNKKYEALLLRQMQMQDEAKKRLDASMNEKERLMNAQILQKLQDEQIQERVAAKISPTKGQQTSKPIKSQIF